VLHLFEQKQSLKQEKKSTLVSAVDESRANDPTAPQSFIIRQQPEFYDQSDGRTPKLYAEFHRLRHQVSFPILRPVFFWFPGCNYTFKC
jgi:hypothetical protein